MANVFNSVDQVKVENHTVIQESKKAICLEVRVVFSPSKPSEYKALWFPKSQIKDGLFSDWILNQKATEIWRGKVASVHGVDGKLAFTF